jgi:membrane protein DedA with SNARE-associated domain
MSPGELWIYVSFFVALVAAGFGFPLPEEIALGAAGVTSASGAARWWILLPVCIAGVLIADVALYLLGHRYGDRILDHPWLSRFIRRDTRHRIEHNFHRYGLSILIIGRLVPGIRAPLFLTAGTTRLPLSRFLLADGLGAGVGNSLFFLLGFWLGDQFLALLQQVDSYRPLLLFAALVAITAVAIYEFLRHPVSTGDPKEVPIIGPQVAVHIKCPPDCPPDQPANTEPAAHPAAAMNGASLEHAPPSGERTAAPASGNGEISQHTAPHRSAENGGPPGEAAPLTSAPGAEGNDS